jgi:AcrR family transcriptional regulator
MHVARTAQPRPAPSQPAALPLKQARALRTRENLLRAGTALLQDGGFDQVSIAQIAKLAGCSVGAFYFSFRDKEAYFRFLLDSVFAQVQATSRQQLVPSRPAEPNPRAAVHRCVEHFIDIARRHEGLMRTVMQHTAYNIEDWQPTRALGLWLIDQYRACVVPHYPAADRPRVARNIEISLLIFMGYINNVVLHKPEPLSLHSPALADWMTAIVMTGLERRDLPDPTP